ncbi:DUF4398 domain-containing protein [Pseudorhodoferax sp. Leaf274]|uniref:DUF4398 domain-containing protein n=1 Tax=Pseudorhodoferax sp. Leaf274 TaxID=1736318 RepID=UPI000702BA0A|nr:DUF4398 domain-containing protein [Pseudorhodoferax sp. Leaf274]KQP43726.1 hypothetical protein ASF44_29635 [Pseudorhodoferax sp. Leaf274]
MHHTNFTQPIHTQTIGRPGRFGRWSRGSIMAALATSALLLGACASKGPPPLEAMTAARAALAQAEAAGAGQLAPVELLSTRDNLAKADAALGAEQFDQARRLADQATADGALAERKARAERARMAALELQRANATLQQEIGPRTTRQ